jgi:hypothetical protein
MKRCLDGCWRGGGGEGKQFRRGSLHFHFQSLKQSLSTLYALYKRILPINPHIQRLMYFLTKYFCNSLTKRCATNHSRINRALEYRYRSDTTKFMPEVTETEICVNNRCDLGHIQLGSKHVKLPFRKRRISDIVTS